MKILIAGCGYLGTALAESLRVSGAEVWGLRRSREGLEALAEAGVRPIEADLEDLSTLRNLPPVDAAVVCQGLSRDTDTYVGTYEQGTRNFAVAMAGKCKKMLSVSSTSVYAVNDGSWVDEDTDPAKGGYASGEARIQAGSLLAAERFILNGAVPGVVFRLAGIYGPGRHRIRALKEGRMRPSLSEVYTNRIHRDDAVEGIKLLLAKGVPGDVYLGADDAPSTQREFYSWLCPRIGVELSSSGAPPAGAPGQGRHSTTNKRCSNKKIKELGFVPKYPDFKAGYESILKEGA